MSGSPSLVGADDTRCRPVRRTGRIEESTGRDVCSQPPAMSTGSQRRAASTVPGLRDPAGARPDHDTRMRRRTVHVVVGAVLATAVVVAGLSRPAASGPPAAAPWPAPGEWCAPPSCTAVADVVRGFDPPLQDWLPGHRGVDVVAPPGMPVAAPAAGRVTFAGAVGGRPVLVLEHDDGRRSTLEPVESDLVRGESVARGQVVGVTGTTGMHCSSCLHWGVREDEVYVDPLLLLDGGPIVLLSTRPEGTPARTKP
ncbi:Peptidase family M23 [Paraoerskovia marina]|uniref:Peptidase family M23 n=2 Tax=Paraoerskovia marina TaxID=545619 RepID=A0A1H1U0Y7_9CELL|nr:Peptidase family M23 [Paraoerskovia marina]